EAMWHSFSGGPSGGNDRALEAYYYSSTGNRTENNMDRWGGKQYPYLKSVDDPGATSWTKSFSHAEFAQKLGNYDFGGGSKVGFTSVSWGEIDGRYDSGRRKKLIVIGTVNGATTVKECSSLQFGAARGVKAP